MNRIKQGGSGAPGVKHSGRLALLGFLTAVLMTSPAVARDFAAMDPGAGGGVNSDEAIKVEPKGDVDIGESVLGVARRVDFFFVNQSGTPVKIQKVGINGDGNVATEIASDDCSKQATIGPGIRCNIEVSVTPSSPGSWSAELLLTHDGAGRIARARLSGKTGGSTAEKKDMGLALSTKEISPVNFGEVEVGGKTVRSALMINDSAEPITVYSIDVIEASNGLTRLDQGCAVDMELKPGESCPVTLLWTPKDYGQVSTDLIIRHSGRMGFAVVPIRGTAKGIGEATGKGEEGKSASSSSGSSKSGAVPPPPSASDLEKAVSGRVAPVSAAALGAAGAGVSEGHLALIGTVGNRAVMLKPDGRTVVVSAGDDIDMDDKTAKVIAISAKSADVMIAGKKKTLQLEASSELIAKATILSKAKDISAAAAGAGGPPAQPVGASSAPSGGLYSTPSGAPK